MKKSSRLTYCLLIFSFVACGHRIPIDRESANNQQSHTGLTINLSMKDALPDVAKIVGILSRQGYDSLTSAFVIFNDSAHCEFEDLALGIWHLQVDAYNKGNVLRYSGKTDVQVIGGITVPVTLHLDPTIGSISLTVTWGGTRNPPPLNGLVAYYPFNGNANDQSGNGHNGIVYGATLTADRFGKPNSAYEFNGLDQYILSTLNELKSANAWTISLWVKAESLNEGGPFSLLTSTPGYNADGFWWHLYPSGNVCYRTHDESAGLQLANQTPASVLAHIWQHHVIVIKENQVIHYLNGQKVFTWNTVFSTSRLDANDLQLRIGEGYNFEYCYPLSATIDEIHVFNRELTESEIQELYTGIE
jgi:hypothetical protein